MLRKWVQWAFVHNESNYIKSYHYTIKYFKMKDRTPKVMYQEHYTLVHVSSSIGKYCLCLMLAWSPKLMTRYLFIPPICVRFFFFIMCFFFLSNDQNWQECDLAGNVFVYREIYDTDNRMMVSLTSDGESVLYSQNS